MTTPQAIVREPVKSKRLGNALVVDLTAPQDNLVLKRGSTLPRASVLVTTAARRIIELSKAGEKIESIVVIGSDGDPTNHPDLREITENLRALRTKWFPRAKLCFFSQARDLASYDVRQTLGMYDKLFLEYSWGTAKTFASATGEKSTVLATLTKQASGFEHLIIEANFFKGDMDNSTDAEVKGWIKKLQEMKPKEIHIVSGVPRSSKKKLRSVTPKRQQQIADIVAEETGLSVSVHEDEDALT